MSPTLAGGCFITEPPGQPSRKFKWLLFKNNLHQFHQSLGPLNSSKCHVRRGTPLLHFLFHLLQFLLFVHKSTHSISFPFNRCLWPVRKCLVSISKNYTLTNYLLNQKNRFSDWILRTEGSFSLFLPSSVQFSHSVVSDSLRPHEPQHARPPCPSPTPRVYSDSRPSSR